MKLLLVSVPLLFSLYGCAAVSTTVPEDAVALSTEEINSTFSGVKESYVGKDDTAVSATATFGEDGAYEGSWKAGKHNGKVSGEWYAEDGKRCLKDEKPDGGGTHLECHAIYKTGDVYTSVNEDGTVHGVHTLTPL